MKNNRILPIFAFVVIGLITSCNQQHTHEWTPAKYVWAEDNSTCTATRECLYDKNHVETETVNSVCVTIETVGCEDGLVRYTADFVNEVFLDQSKDVVIEGSGHNWGNPTYTWSDDKTSCTAERVCLTDNSHKETETASSTLEIDVPASYEEEGKGRYIVNFKNKNFETQSCDVVIPKSTELIYTKYDGYYSVKAGSTAVSGDIIIPSTYDDLPVAKIEDAGFVRCNLITSAQLPESITYIGKCAFGGCSNLISVNIPGSVRSLPGDVFQNCSLLKDVTIEEGVVNISYPNSTGCFKNCDSLEEIYFPDSVEYIGHYAFFNCSSLKRIRWPDNAVTIGMSAFEKCTNLESIPSRIANIESWAFLLCCSLTEITIPKKESTDRFGFGIFNTCKSLKKVVFEEGVQHISENMFANCKSLSQVIISSTIKIIDPFAFSDCVSLYEVINKSSISLVKSDEQFRGCDNLEAIISDENYSKMSVLDGIKYYIKTNGNIVLVDFENRECNSLTIPNYITEIGNTALYNFNNLTTLNYEGTTEQWIEMSKGEEWNYGIPATVVHCSNGEVTI